MTAVVVIGNRILGIAWRTDKAEAKAAALRDAQFSALHSGTSLEGSTCRIVRDNETIRLEDSHLSLEKRRS